MKNIIKTLSYLIISVLLLSIFSCSPKNESVKNIPKLPTYLVQKANVPIYNEFVGQVYGLKDIPIRARVDGFLNDIHFNEGTRVEAGQLLYSIDPDPYLAEVAAFESKVAEAQTIMVNAEAELNRYKPLAESRAVSESDLDAAQAKFDASKANLKAAEANLEQAMIKLSYCSLRSPIDGLIGKTEARVGEYVGKDPNPVILNSVSRIDTVRVQFSISESKYLELVKARRSNKSPDEMKKEVEEGVNDTEIKLILADGSIYEETGKFDFVDNQINSYTASLLIQASFPNPSRILRPGLYAKVRLKLQTAEGALVIPQRCISELQGNYSVFVVNDSNQIENRPIDISYKYGDMAIVKEGISENDRIIIDAIQQARPGMTVQADTLDFVSKTTGE